MKPIKIFKVKGIEIKLLQVSRVYKPSTATRLIAENLPEMEGLNVLDLGTGSGVLALLSSKLGASHVVATDVSRRVLRTAEANLRLNNISNVELRLGSLYNPIQRGERFDVIISNPPMTPSPNPLPRYTWGGIDGRAVLDPVIKNAAHHLRDGGKLIVPAVSLVGIGETLRLMRETGFKVRVLDYSTYPFGSTLLRLRDYLKKLPNADYFYDQYGRPRWRIVLFEGVKI